MVHQNIDGITLEVTQGDIASQQDIEAVVNAANARLQTGGGVAGAIHRAAGPGLAKECAPMAPIKPGQAVISGGHNLPNNHVIHCLGPVYGKDQPENELLANCYENALRLADENEIASIAFPAISTGAFGFPVQEAAKIAFQKIQQMTGTLKFVKKIRFVLFGKNDYDVHAQVMNNVMSQAS